MVTGANEAVTYLEKCGINLNRILNVCCPDLQTWMHYCFAIKIGKLVVPPRTGSRDALSVPVVEHETSLNEHCMYLLYMVFTETKLASLYYIFLHLTTMT